MATAKKNEDDKNKDSTKEVEKVEKVENVEKENSGENSTETATKAKAAKAKTPSKTKKPASKTKAKAKTSSAKTSSDAKSAKKPASAMSKAAGKKPASKKASKKAPVEKEKKESVSPNRRMLDVGKEKWPRKKVGVLTALQILKEEVPKVDILGQLDAWSMNEDKVNFFCHELEDEGYVTVQAYENHRGLFRQATTKGMKLKLPSLSEA